MTVQSLNRDTGALYRGLRLSTATQWSETRSVALSPVEAEFLAASRSRERVHVQRARIVAAALAALLVVATMAAGLAFWQRQSAVAA